jgi:hypothetical protein
MLCLFCNGIERTYKSEPGIDFICSKCVQILLSASPEQLYKAYCKAKTEGYVNKVRAIEFFLDSEAFNNDRKTKKSQRGMVRKRPLRKVRPTRDQIRAK